MSFITRFNVNLHRRHIKYVQCYTYLQKVYNIG